MKLIYRHFNEDSIENYKIINNYLKKKEKKDILEVDVTKIDKFLNVLKSSNIEKNLQEIKKNIKINKTKITDPINLTNNIFISDDIKEESVNIKYKYDIKVEDNVTINLFTLNEKDKINLFKTVNIYNWLLNLSNQPKKRAISLDFYLLTNKKKLDEKHVLGPKHVNSGSTTNKKFIQIWRKEEFYKVYIHELIHYFGYDFYDSSQIISSSLKEIYNINLSCRIIPNEAYVDIWAMIFNCLYISWELSTSSESQIKLFKFMLTHEIYFCLYQTAKLLKHFGFSSMEELSNNQSDKKIKQQTSVFSYYIIKSSLFYNLNKFFDFVKDFDFIKFNETDENLKGFRKLIIECMGDESFVKEVNNLMYLVQNKTLRMSLTEISYD